MAFVQLTSCNPVCQVLRFSLALCLSHADLSDQLQQGLVRVDRF